MHINIQGGLSFKVNDLQLILGDSNIDVVCINEHWLQLDEIFILNTIPGYKLAASFCREFGLKGGGTCILLKDHLDYKEREDLCMFNISNIFEASCLEIMSLNCIIISLYRVPLDSNYLDFMWRLESLFETLRNSANNKNIYVAADFNIDLLDKSSSSRKEKQKKEFVGLLDTYGLKACFHEATRVTLNSKTCIDNILINKFTFERKPILMNIETGISDHRAIFISIKDDNVKQIDKKPHAQKSRLFSNKNITLFLNKLEHFQWTDLNTMSSQQMYNTFLNQFVTVFETCFPLKFYNKRSKKKRKNWITEGIRVSSAKKRQLHKIAKHSDDPNVKAYYKRYNAIFKSVCKEAKKMANANFIKKSENKSKAVWSVIKAELGAHKTNHYFPNLKVDDKVITDGMEIVQYFNNMFLNTVDNINVRPNRTDAVRFVSKYGKPQVEFDFKHVSVNKVSKTFKSLNSKTSSGCDGIPVNIMIRAAKYISIPICCIINQCFEEGLFPNQLKFAEVKPLFKKGDRENPGNYRPVSILNSFSKIFEKVANNQISSFFETNFIFSSNQYGFRPDLNTNKAISHLLNHIARGLDESRSTAAVFCDLSKAFDCVSHDVLLDKLKFYNFSHKSLSWIKSYLSNRKQRTVLFHKNIKYASDWQEIKHGVPQGSILGPLLFLIFINDLPVNIGYPLILYADDTTSIVQSKNSILLSESIKQNLNQLSAWFKANGLKLNSSKTQIVKFSTFQNKEVFPDNILFEDQVLEIVNTCNFLGIILDKNLSWKSCVDKLSKRLNSCCYQMLVLRDSVDIQTRIMVYYALFYSLIYYGIEFWGISTDSKTVFKIQKKYLRIMTFSKKNSSCKDIFNKLQILTIPSLYIFKSLVNIKNNYNSLFDNQHQHNYTTRNKHNFLYPKHNLTLYERNSQYMGMKFFNKLPYSLQSLDDLNKFKTRLKEILLLKTYYSIEEFLQDKLA